MDALEQYIHDDAPDALVQIAVIHAEFEAIHPFLDGNGRLGRLLIPLFLQSKGLLVRPNFYMSEYFEANRHQYYERLLSISRDGDWTAWIQFFLEGLIVQAKTNQTKALAILDLYQERKRWIVDATKSQHAIKALDTLFERPIFKASDFALTADIPPPTAARILRILKDSLLLAEVRAASGRRPAVLAFSELLNLAEGRDAF